MAKRSDVDVAKVKAMVERGRELLASGGVEEEPPTRPIPVYHAKSGSFTVAMNQASDSDVESLVIAIEYSVRDELKIAGFGLEYFENLDTVVAYIGKKPTEAAVRKMMVTEGILTGEED